MAATASALWCSPLFYFRVEKREASPTATGYTTKVWLCRCPRPAISYASARGHAQFYSRLQLLSFEKKVSTNFPVAHQIIQWKRKENIKEEDVEVLKNNLVG